MDQKMHISKKQRHCTIRSTSVFIIVTERVSRVLFALPRGNHLSSLCVTAQFKPEGSATMNTKRRATAGISTVIQGVASDRVYSGLPLPGELVSSYLAFPSLPPEGGGLFLLHFPGGHPRRTLSVILPCDARTFLAITPFGNISRDCPVQSRILYPKNDEKSSESAKTEPI